jgi:putative membrane protein
MTRGLGGFAAVALAFVVLFAVMGGGMMQGYAGVGPMHASGWGMGMGIGWLVMLVFWVALGLGVVALVRSSGRASGERAEDVLRRRFAAGEIDRDRYEQMRGVLRDEAPHAV